MIPRQDDIIHLSKTITFGKLDPEAEVFAQEGEITDFRTVFDGDEIVEIDGKFYRRKFGPDWKK